MYGYNFTHFFNKCFEIDDDGKLEDFWENIWARARFTTEATNKDRQINFLRQCHHLLFIETNTKGTWA